ncbi:MAG: heme-binding protein [Pseudomonadota bacterium]|nr:heme-binding protein [Pseudomonadota bacterium]
MTPKHSTPQSVISADAAHTAVRAAVEKAGELGIRINVAVTDASGVLAAFLRMPGAFLHSVDIAIDKAYTAASFGWPTSQWEGIFASDPALARGMPHRPRIVVFGGGLPIREGGREGGALIGGIGVSGGSAEQDEVCARAGLAALGLNA